MALSNSTIFWSSWGSVVPAGSFPFRCLSSCNVVFRDAIRLFSIATALNEYAKIFFLHGSHKLTAPRVVLSNSQVSWFCEPQFVQALLYCDLVPALSRIISSFWGLWLLRVCFLSFFRANSIPHFVHRTISFLWAFFCSFSDSLGEEFEEFILCRFWYFIGEVIWLTTQFTCATA